MTAAAGMIALQDLPEGPPIPPALMLNLDASAGSVAQKYGGGVLITEEVKKELRKQVQSTTEPRTKKRIGMRTTCQCPAPPAKSRVLSP